MPISFFNTKDPQIKITDKVWMREEAKWAECLRLFNENQNIVFIAWFEETKNKLEFYFKQKKANIPKVILYRLANTHTIHNSPVIFAEHFPLSKKENELYISLQLSAATIFSSLDEPLFLQFGGDNIKKLMEQMGMKQEEMIQHPMITKALINAQNKLQKKIVAEQSARSQSEWLQKNVK